MNKVLILGATGMLGHSLMEMFTKSDLFNVYATTRKLDGLSRWFSDPVLERVMVDVNAESFDSVAGVVTHMKPDVVINCIGIIKQLPSAKDPITAININSLFPHKVAQVCKQVNARLIHISTDCVFDGVKGSYTEKDESNATDLYGRTKFLGEVYYPHCVTLRTSIIGHELKSKYGLVEWFLAQEGKVRGFTNAIYTGFPTVELARIIKDYVIPNPELKGLYQVSSDPISKYELLKLVADTYGKQIEIEPYDDFHLDRSLDSTLFRQATGYPPPAWPDLVKAMHDDYIKGPYLKQA